MPGPKGKGGVSQDTYDGVAPMSISPAPAKQINASDSKSGPPSPTSGKAGAGINRDTFYE